MGVENFTANLMTAPCSRPSVQRFADGTWGVSCVLTEDDLYFMGQNWICAEGDPLCSENTSYGSHPCSDITAIDWSSLPSTLAQAQAQLDTSHWATPKKAHPEDRLHLRAEPYRDSRSLGKYYNGAPLEVLEKGDRWMRVRIGQTTGYMMTSYLAFGDDMRQAAPYRPSKSARYLLTDLTLHTNKGETTAVQLPTGMTANYTVIRLASGDRWIVWDPFANCFGLITGNQLWDGNG